MLPSTPPLIRARFEHHEANERDMLRPSRRPTMASPVLIAGKIAVALFEVEAGFRPIRQLERFSHPTLWERLVPRLCYRGGPATTYHSLRRVLVQEHIPGLVDAVAVLRRGPSVEAVAMRLDAATGRWELIELQYRSATATAISPADPFEVGCERRPTVVLAHAERPVSLRSPARRRVPA
jgi:Family of unknown function (DUF6459)